MTSPMHTEESIPLSDSLLLVAAEQAWPGQVPTQPLSRVASELRAHIKSFPCLQQSDIVERLLKKLDTVQTNGDFVQTTQAIFLDIARVRSVLAHHGILRHADEPYVPLMAATPHIAAPSDSGDTVRRLHKNVELQTILQYTNRILEILAHTSHTIQNQAMTTSEPVALVDAAPIRFPGEKSVSNTPLSEVHSSGETKPEQYVWGGICFDKRMKMVPFLASGYLQGKKSITSQELKEEYQHIMGKELHDANMYALIRNIRLKFEGMRTSVPFKTQKNGGIEFIYDTELKKDSPEEEASIASAGDVQKNAFFDEPFDPRSLTNHTPLEIRELTEEAIKTLDLNETSKQILMTLMHQKKATHVSELAKKCHVTIPEINSYTLLILQTLWIAGYPIRIEVENDYISLIK